MRSMTRLLRNSFSFMGMHVELGFGNCEGTFVSVTDLFIEPFSSPG